MDRDRIPGSEPEKAEDYMLCVITTEKADDTLRFGDGMVYEEGIDNGIWMTDKPVCAVSSDLMHYSYIGEDGDRYLDMNVDYVPTIRVNTKTLDYSLRVIGTTEEVKKMVYVPFYTILNSTQEHDAAFNLDSLSFTVRTTICINGAWCVAGLHGRHPLHHCPLFHDPVGQADPRIGRIR